MSLKMNMLEILSKCDGLRLGPATDALQPYLNGSGREERAAAAQMTSQVLMQLIRDRLVCKKNNVYAITDAGRAFLMADLAPDVPTIHSLLKRLALGGKVESDLERKMLERLSVKLDQPVPAAACPACWFRRTLEEYKRGEEELEAKAGDEGQIRD